MEGIALIFALLALLSLVAISIYFYMEFDKHKISNNVDYNKLSTNITDEQKNRLSNLSSIVDQVNVVNKDIKTTYDNLNTAQNTKITNLGIKLSGIETGFGSLLSTTIPGSTSNIPLSSIANIANIDVQLLKKVNVIGGMTIKDVQAAGKSFKVCGGVQEKCIEFPNSSGNTYLTGFGANASIILDGPTQLLGAVNFSNKTAFGSDIMLTSGNVGIGTIKVDTSTDPNSLLIKSDQINLDGNVNMTKNTTLNNFTLKSGTNSANIGIGTARESGFSTTNVVTVDKGLKVLGETYIQNKISIQSGDLTVATIGIDDNNKLNISTNTGTMTLNGNVNVIGELSENGQRVGISTSSVNNTPQLVAQPEASSVGTL